MSESERLTKRNWRRVNESPFFNEYGGLSLVEDDDRYYLQSESLFQKHFYGPLTPAQISAYHLLVNANCIGFEGNA